jgi:thiosulfate/3-mercaptopyruvate sulfurtransferase
MHATLPRSVTYLAALFVWASAQAEEAYPKPDLLIEPAILAKADDFVVLDARDRKSYLQGHVPGARYVNHEAWAKAFDDGKSPDEWGKRIGELGVSSDSRVAIYDGNLSREAARIWWLLRYWGVKDVRIVNGGWHGWTSANLPTERETPPGKPTMFQPKPESHRLAAKSDLLKALPKDELQIVDARSHAEHCGLLSLNNKRGGAIPGAKSIEWSDLLDRNTQRFKSPGELRKLFADAGVDLNRPTATYCQSGGRSAVMAFGMELMGANGVRNYYRSWSEWGNADDTPVVKPTPASKKRNWDQVNAGCPGHPAGTSKSNGTPPSKGISAEAQ